MSVHDRRAEKRRRHPSYWRHGRFQIGDACGAGGVALPGRWHVGLSPGCGDRRDGLPPGREDYSAGSLPRSGGAPCCRIAATSGCRHAGSPPHRGDRHAGLPRCEFCWVGSIPRRGLRV